MTYQKKSKYLDQERFKEMYAQHPEWAIKACSAIINGCENYLNSLRLKIKKRENIPNWYIQNKI